MAQIALTIAPALTVALTLVASGSQVSLTAPPDAPAHTLTLAPDLTAVSMVGEVLRGPRGLKGEPGSPGLLPGDVEAIASAESEELRIDMDALVAATLSI